MKKQHHARIIYPVFALALLILLSIACGGSTTEKLADAAKPADPVTVNPVTNLQQSDTAPAPVAIVPVTPAQPTSIATPFQITSQGFGQKGRSVGYAFLATNPNLSMAMERTPYQIAAFGPDGAVVETDSGYIELMLPGQTLGVGGTLFVNEGITILRIEVQVSNGKAVASESIPTFTVETISYQADEYFPKVMAVIHSPYNRAIDNLRVTAVVYDSANNIIGGGFSYANFILAGSSRGVEVSVESSQDVGRVELYATLSGLSSLTSPDDRPSGTNDLLLIRHGYGQKEREIGYGLVVQNPNPGFSIESSQYHLTAYADDGRVLGVEEGYLEVLLPNQTLGIGGSLYAIGDPIARADVQVLAGRYIESSPLPGFTAENISYQVDEYFPKLTGQIVNPYTKDVTHLRLSAILYDAAGNINGGGFTYLDFVPASGKAAAEVSVTSSGQPTGAELYAAVSSLSDLK